tara:strand:+ start:215 stop:484 length:270 start_codon:yes stop_codon:yes gene_type:complete
MNRGEVTFNVLFKENVSMEASYFMMCGDPKDISELQEAITKLLCKIILGKEDDFVRAEVFIDIQDHPDYYCATFENLEGPEAWASRTVH